MILPVLVTCWGTAKLSDDGKTIADSAIEKRENSNQVCTSNCKRHLHAHLSIVDQVLQWVVAGELVHHLLVIGDGSWAGVLRTDHTWDGDVLDIREVCKYAGSSFLSDLWGKRGWVHYVRNLLRVEHQLGAFKLRSPTFRSLEQAVIASSVMEKLNLMTGGSAVQSGIPLHSCFECSELRASSDSLYPLK